MNMWMHLIGLLGGFLLDLIVGDPYWLPHPVRWMGSLISILEKHDLGDKKAVEKSHKELSSKEKRMAGIRTVLVVTLVSVILSAAVLWGAYFIHPLVGVTVEIIMTYQMLATKCLKVESMKVYQALKHGTLQEARNAVAMIVGRDTNVLSEEGVAKAAVETVAENTSDGVIAPMLYMAIGGPVLGFFYKAVNTMDSMIGYKNDRYLDYGRCAAKLDDALNFLPSRISAALMIMACLFLGKNYDEKRALAIFKRDRRNHASPNSAQTEAVCAGALGLLLAGDASYFGKVVKKPFIGDPVREIEPEDIQRANALLYMTALECQIFCQLLLSGIFLLGCSFF